MTKIELKFIPKEIVFIIKDRYVYEGKVQRIIIDNSINNIVYIVRIIKSNNIVSDEHYKEENIFKTKDEAQNKLIEQILKQER